MSSWHGHQVLVALMVSALLLASCSSAPSTPPTSLTDTKPYGSLMMAAALEPVIDPHKSRLSAYQAFSAAVFDSLVELTPEGQVRPGIAERWEISPDGKTHTLYIRKGVKFHDGSDLTGADIKFSIERMLAPEALHPDSRVWRDQLVSVELKDDYAVVLNLRQPQFELLKGFEDFAGSPTVVPKKYVEEKGADYFLKNPIGSGPWKVLSWVPNTRLELEALENHWRAVPKFKNITLLNVLEEGTKVAMLKTGELDIASVAPDSVPGLKADGLHIVDHDGASQWFAYIFYDMDNPQKYALGDVRVRKALSLAINRKELADKVFNGYAEPTALFYVSKTAFFFDANVLKPDPYDPEQAKRLLADAGYPNGFKTTITDIGGGSALSTANLALAGYLRRVGANADVVPLDPALASTRYNPKMVPEAYNTIMSYFSTGAVFQFEKMAIMYHSKKSSAKNIRNPRLDELIDKVPLTKDPSEKKRMALETAVLAKNEYNDLSVLDLHTIYAVGSKVGQLTPTKGMVGLASSLETITHAK